MSAVGSKRPEAEVTSAVLVAEAASARVAAQTLAAEFDCSL